MFNRNKKSIAIDLRNAEGVQAAIRLASTADVVLQNFKPGVMKKYGLDYASLSRLNPGLIYVNHTGFLPGPYERRTALDEVVQMMGGLAYMTGRPGDPLRAGTSVNDIMGGMFGAIGAMAALMQRAQTGKGQEIDSALFENNVFLVGQHMMQYAVTGQPAAPMPERISSWGLYDIFSVKDGEQIFLAVVSDPQWRTFCSAMGFEDMLHDPALQTNNDRVRARSTMLPELRQRLAKYSAAELAKILKPISCHTHRLRGPSSCLMTPICWPQVVWLMWCSATVNAQARLPRPRCCPFAWLASACPCAATRPRPVSTRVSCWHRWAIRLKTLLLWRRPGLWRAPETVQACHPDPGWQLLCGACGAGLRGS